MAAPVRFTVVWTFDAPPRRVWDALVDWKGHEHWVPSTRVRVDAGDPHALGATFTAWTGWWRLAIEDRMEVVRFVWDDADAAGECEVRKLGPVLSGHARFSVAPLANDPTRTQVEWTEDVAVARVPGVVAPVLCRAGILTFRRAMRRLSGRLAA